MENRLPQTKPWVTELSSCWMLSDVCYVVILNICLRYVDMF